MLVVNSVAQVGGMAKACSSIETLTTNLLGSTATLVRIPSVTPALTITVVIQPYLLSPFSKHW